MKLSRATLQLFVTGALFGYHSAFVRFPQQRFSVIVLCNHAMAAPETLGRKIADIYLARGLKPTMSNLVSVSGLPDSAVFAGTYLDPRTKTIYTFTADHGNLMAWGAGSSAAY